MFAIEATAFWSSMFWKKRSCLNRWHAPKIDILNWLNSKRKYYKFLYNIQINGTHGRHVQWLVAKVFKQELSCAREHNVRDIRRRARLVSCSPVLVRLTKKLQLLNDKLWRTNCKNETNEGRLHESSLFSKDIHFAFYPKTLNSPKDCFVSQIYRDL